MQEITDVVKSTLKESLKDIYVNQNVLICISSYVAIGVVEFVQIEHPDAMPVLYCCSKWLSIASTISVLLSLITYTFNYCKKKLTKK